jgi:hypothetical protein
MHTRSFPALELTYERSLTHLEWTRDWTSLQAFSHLKEITVRQTVDILHWPWPSCQCLQKIKYSMYIMNHSSRVVYWSHTWPKRKVHPGPPATSVHSTERPTKKVPFSLNFKENIYHKCVCWICSLPWPKSRWKASKKKEKSENHRWRSKPQILLALCSVLFPKWKWLQTETTWQGHSVKGECFHINKTFKLMAINTHPK